MCDTFLNFQMPYWTLALRMYFFFDKLSQRGCCPFPMWKHERSQLNACVLSASGGVKIKVGPCAACNYHRASSLSPSLRSTALFKVPVQKHTQHSMKQRLKCFEEMRREQYFENLTRVCIWTFPSWLSQIRHKNTDLTRTYVTVLNPPKTAGSYCRQCFTFHSEKKTKKCKTEINWKYNNLVLEHNIQSATNCKNHKLYCYKLGDEHILISLQTS